jgi:spermidine/putrescine transport system ATP-binding protein
VKPQGDDTRTRLTLEGVSKRFESTVALDTVSADFAAGSYVVLLGPSGSGKTTLLSILGGFTVPSTGRVMLGGTDITHLPPARRPTATVFQDYALFPHMTVGDNVGFGLSVRGVPKAQINERVQAALRLVGLDGFAARSITAASGGQRQRIALARALVIEPTVLLLDEPLGALDLSLRRQMQDELRRIQRAQGRTFVHVTHDQEEAMAIADVVVIMNAGRIEDMGPPQRVYERPRTRFAARFLGESSVLPGTLLGEAAAHVALRPEALVIGLAPTGARSLGHAVVEDAVYQGSFMRIGLRHAGGERLLVKVDPRTLAGGAVPASGDTVSLSVQPHGVVPLED